MKPNRSPARGLFLIDFVSKSIDRSRIFADYTDTHLYVFSVDLVLPLIINNMNINTNHRSQQLMSYLPPPYLCRFIRYNKHTVYIFCQKNTRSVPPPVPLLAGGGDTLWRRWTNIKGGLLSPWGNFLWRFNVCAEWAQRRWTVSWNCRHNMDVVCPCIHWDRCSTRQTQTAHTVSCGVSVFSYDNETDHKHQDWRVGREKLPQDPKWTLRIFNSTFHSSSTSRSIIDYS